MSETTMFQDGAILITDKRVVLEGKTYALHNITSVGVNEKSSGKQSAWILAALAGCCFVLGFGLMATPGDTGDLLFMSLAMGGMFGVIAAALFLSSPEFTVGLTTSAGEVQAFKSKSRQQVESIVGAITDAMIART
jgi:hypothetical protein